MLLMLVNYGGSTSVNIGLNLTPIFANILYLQRFDFWNQRGGRQ